MAWRRRSRSGPREAHPQAVFPPRASHTSPRPGGGWGATTPSRAEMTPSPQGPPGRRRPVRRRRAAQPSPVASRPAGARSRGPSHRLSSAPPSSIGSSCSSCADAVSGLARPCAVRVHPGGLADVVRPKRTMGGVFSLALSSRLTSSHSVPSTRGVRSDGDDGWWRDPLTARCREAHRARQRKRRRTDVWRTGARARTPFGELPPHRAPEPAHIREERRLKDAKTFEAEKRKAAEQAARDRLAGAVKRSHSSTCTSSTIS